MKREKALEKSNFVANILTGIGVVGTLILVFINIVYAFIFLCTLLIAGIVGVLHYNWIDKIR